MFIRVWEYEVDAEHRREFTALYGPDGPWGELFARGSGFQASELFRDGHPSGRFVVVDRWLDADHWVRFCSRFTGDYHALSERFRRLARTERLVFEGNSVS